MQFIYLILSIYFGRKNPLFFLIFPLALIQGTGAFIDSRTVLVAPDFFLQVKNIYKDIIIFYLLFTVLYLYKRVDFNLLLETPVKWYSLMIIALSAITLLSYGTSFEAVSVIRIFLYIVIGFYLLVLILSAADYSKFIQFLNVLFWANAAQSVLYILNSSRVLPIFDQSLIYREVAIGAETFYRDFRTIPVFSNFLFVYGLISILFNEKKFNRIAVYMTLGTYPLVLLYSFTRSLLFVTGLEILAVLIVTTVLKPSKFLKPYLLVLPVGAIVLFMFMKNNFSGELGYFNERVAGAFNESRYEVNVDARIKYHVNAWEKLAFENSLWTGHALNKELEPEMSALGAWAADSTIPYLLIYTGIIGVLIYYWLQIYFIFLCTKFSFYRLEPIAIALFIVLSVSLLRSFLIGGISWGDPFMFFNYAMVLFLSYSFGTRKINFLSFLYLMDKGIGTKGS